LRNPRFTLQLKPGARRADTTIRRESPRTTLEIAFETPARRHRRGAVMSARDAASTMFDAYPLARRESRASTDRRLALPWLEG
jgi:hypothetical protein